MQEVQRQAAAVAMDMRRHVLTPQHPTLEDSFGMVYGEPHPLVEQELREHREYVAGFEDEA